MGASLLAPAKSIYYVKKILSFRNMASSHNDLVPLKTVCKKKRGIALGDRE